MTEASVEKINACLNLAFESALELLIETKLTPVEQAKTRLALQHPSDLIIAARDEAQECLNEGLSEGLSLLMNAIIHPEIFDEDDD